MVLEVVAGPAAGSRLEVESELLIGRHADGPGGLGGDAELSRRHARVFVDSGRLMVEDLGSTNGTQVNGVEIGNPTGIGDGDVVAVGGSSLRVAEAPVPELDVGGTYSVPDDLLSFIASRAPVTKGMVMRAAALVLLVVLAVNFAVRQIFISAFDTRSDVGTLKPFVLVMVSLAPVIGSSIGFYENFGRPASHSPLRYMIPGFVITCVMCTIELIVLPDDATAAEHVATVLIALVAPAILTPTLLGLRVKAAAAAEERLVGRASR
ncbi:MAG TPA: FHA domain-containing protein [Thermoleophilaceae bacterium]|nr:FHA domain-containing protein [Thermoleophilaceae bacterium]